MNMIAVDIGNTNITIALFIKGKEQFVKPIPGTSKAKLTQIIDSAWQQIPIAKRSKEKKRDGVIVVSSVNPDWTKLVKKIAREKLDERIYLIPEDIPYPMDLSVDPAGRIGTDRVVSAAAAYAVTEDALVVADFGTAVTVDLVDERGIFLGGVIFPGFEISAKALKNNTALLPEVKVKEPKAVYGKTTEDAVNCGLYYSAIGALREIVEHYAEKIGRWPQTVITGSAAKLIHKDCDFVDSYVPNLVIKGIALAYQKYIEKKSDGLL